jgi:hypothetical protein
MCAKHGCSFGFDQIDSRHVIAIALCTGPDAGLHSTMSRIGKSDVCQDPSVARTQATSCRVPEAIRIFRCDDLTSEPTDTWNREGVECILWRFVRVAHLAPPELQSEWSKVLECT